MRIADDVTLINKVESEVLERSETGAPIASRHIATDANGKAYTLLPKAASPIIIPWPDPEGSVGERGQCILFEQLSEFTLEETGEKGKGSDEHGVLFPHSGDKFEAWDDVEVRR